jgi:hypothetical protein
VKLAPLLDDDSHGTRYMAAAAIIRLNLKYPTITASDTR